MRLVQLHNVRLDPITPGPEHCMSKKTLSISALEVETFPIDGEGDTPMMRPPNDTERDVFTCWMVGCTYQSPCV